MSRHLTENLKGTVREAASLAPLSPAEEMNSLSPRRVIAALFRQSKTIIGLTTIGVLATGFMALSTPNSYRSTGTFLYTTGSESVQVDPLLGGGVGGEEILGSATYVFQADGLLTRVIDTPDMMKKLLRPNLTVNNAFLKITQWQSPETIDFESEAARDAARKVLRNNLELTKPRNTEVLEVAFTAGDPKLAQEILNVYMEEAKQWHLDVYNDEERLKTVERNAQVAIDALEAAKEELRSFLRGLQVSDFQIALAGRVEEYRAQQAELRAVQRSIAQLQSQIKLYEEALTQTPQKIVELMQVDEPDAYKLVLQNAIAVERMELTRMQSRRNNRSLEDDPEYKQILQTIAAFEKDLAAHLKQTGGSNLQSVERINLEYENLKAKLSEARLQYTAYQGQLKGVKEDAEAAAAKLQELESKEERHRDLTQKVVQLRTAKERNDTELAQALRKRELAKGAFSSLQRIDQASKPLEKNGPNRTKLVLMGFFGGLFAALGLVLLRTLGDTTVRGREDLDRLQGVAVLGTFPRLDGRNVRRHRSLREQST